MNQAFENKQIINASDHITAIETMQYIPLLSYVLNK